MLSLPVETVIFDLDGTLRHNVPSADDTQFQIANQLGANVPVGLQLLGARWAHAYWAQSPELVEDLRKFGEPDENFWVHYSFRYLLALTVPTERAMELAPILSQRMEAEFTPMNYVAPDVAPTLKSLKKAGFSVGLVSNRSLPCHEECEQLGLLEYFDFAYVAAEVEAWKPDPRIFDRALELSGTSPERAIYVGDNYYADIIGAHNAGLQPVLFDRDCVFPDADCAVIKSVGELLGLLGINGKPAGNMASCDA
jgi:putative hydrolase of the HAD superfamily